MPCGKLPTPQALEVNLARRRAGRHLVRRRSANSPGRHHARPRSGTSPHEVTVLGFVHGSTSFGGRPSAGAADELAGVDVTEAEHDRDLGMRVDERLAQHTRRSFGAGEPSSSRRTAVSRTASCFTPAPGPSAASADSGSHGTAYVSRRLRAVQPTLTAALTSVRSPSARTIYRTRRCLRGCARGRGTGRHRPGSGEQRPGPAEPVREVIHGRQSIRCWAERTAGFSVAYGGDGPRSDGVPLSASEVSANSALLRSPALCSGNLRTCPARPEAVMRWPSTLGSSVGRAV